MFVGLSELVCILTLQYYIPKQKNVDMGPKRSIKKALLCMMIDHNAIFLAQ
jgi:hypothetical protein